MLMLVNRHNFLRGITSITLERNDSFMHYLSFTLQKVTKGLT